MSMDENTLLTVLQIKADCKIRKSSGKKLKFIWIVTDSPYLLQQGH